MKPPVDLHNVRQTFLTVELDKAKCVQLSCEVSYT